VNRQMPSGEYRAPIIALCCNFAVMERQIVFERVCSCLGYMWMFAKCCLGKT